MVNFADRVAVLFSVCDAGEDAAGDAGGGGAGDIYDSATAAQGWTAISVALPFLVYFQSAMMSDLNIGVRHVLPLYPFIFVTIGWAAAMAWRRWRIASAITLVVLMVGLSVESLSAFPNFIPFFNTAAGAECRVDFACWGIRIWIGGRICRCWLIGRNAIRKRGCTSAILDWLIRNIMASNMFRCLVDITTTPSLTGPSGLA
jgi:hypothetical protein